MKRFALFILMFCCSCIFAQNSQLETERENLTEQKIGSIDNLKTSVDQEKLDSLNTAKNKTYKPTSTLDKELKKQNSSVAQNIDIVKEINAVINYKVNRLWREDLYCLVCLKDFENQQMA